MLKYFGHRPNQPLQETQYKLIHVINFTYHCQCNLLELNYVMLFNQQLRLVY